MKSLLSSTVVLAVAFAIAASCHGQTDTSTSEKADAVAKCGRCMKSSASESASEVAACCQKQTVVSTAVNKTAEQPTGVVRCGCCKQGGAAQTTPIILALDIDKDGVVSAVEIKNATQSLLALDSNGDGNISRKEMHAGTGFSSVNASTKQQAATKSNLQLGATPAYFAEKMLERDTNGNGKLEKSEMNGSTLKILHLIDSDDDEVLTFDELKNMMNQMKINVEVKGLHNEKQQNNKQKKTRKRASR